MDLPPDLDAVPEDVEPEAPAPLDEAEPEAAPKASPPVRVTLSGWAAEENVVAEAKEAAGQQWACYSVLQAYFGVLSAELLGDAARNVAWKDLGGELAWLAMQEADGLVNSYT